MELGTPNEKVTERRRAPRRGALKNAVIVFNNGHCTMGCQIVDMSDTGAKLMPADILLCPKEFVLKPQIGEPRGSRCPTHQNLPPTVTLPGQPARQMSSTYRRATSAG